MRLRWAILAVASVVMLGIWLGPYGLSLYHTEVGGRALDAALVPVFPDRLPRPLKVLTPEQVAEIDRALEEVGPFGEVRLVKAKGKVRFIQRLESRELPRRGEEEAG